MKTNEILERSQKFIPPYRVTDGKKFRLKDIDPGDTGEATSEDKPRAKELLEKGIAVTGRVLRAGSMVGAPNFSGHGRGARAPNGCLRGCNPIELARIGRVEVLSTAR